MEQRGELLTRGHLVVDIESLLSECLGRWGVPVAAVMDTHRADEVAQAARTVRFPPTSPDRQTNRIHQSGARRHQPTKGGAVWSRQARRKPDVEERSGRDGDRPRRRRKRKNHAEGCAPAFPQRCVGGADFGGRGRLQRMVRRTSTRTHVPKQPRVRPIGTHGNRAAQTGENMGTNPSGCPHGPLRTAQKGS